MAQPKTASGTKLKIKLGDGESPEGFDAPCGIISTGVNFSADTQDIVVPDCSNPDLPAWVQREVNSQQGEITGSGVLATDSLDLWEEWFFAQDKRNVQVLLDIPDADGGRAWQFGARLTRFNVQGNRGNKVQLEVTIVTDGAPTVVAVA